MKLSMQLLANGQQPTPDTPFIETAIPDEDLALPLETFCKIYVYPALEHLKNRAEVKA